LPEEQRLPLVTERFAQRLAALAHDAGLAVGSAYDGINGRAQRGRFQQLGRAALLAFRDRSKISRYTVRKINANDATPD
jgi:hypothetical protein